MSDVLNMEVIEELRSELNGDDDSDIVADLTEIYFESAPKRLATIEEGLAAGDGVKASEAAHALKSASGNLGAMKLMSLCQDVEHKGKDGDLAGAQKAFDEIKGLYPQVKSALEGLVKK